MLWVNKWLRTEHEKGNKVFMKSQQKLTSGRKFTFSLKSGQPTGRKSIVLVDLHWFPFAPLSFVLLSFCGILLLIPQLIDLLLRAEHFDLIGSYCWTTQLQRLHFVIEFIPAMQPEMIASSWSITFCRFWRVFKPLRSIVARISSKKQSKMKSILS